MDETTPGINENIPPAQNPLTMAKATRGGTVEREDPINY